MAKMEARRSTKPSPARILVVRTFVDGMKDTYKTGTCEHNELRDSSFRHADNFLKTIYESLRTSGIWHKACTVRLLDTCLDIFLVFYDQPPATIEPIYNSTSPEHCEFFGGLFVE
jgi:hypothetical protein